MQNRQRIIFLHYKINPADSFMQQQLVAFNSCENIESKDVFSTLMFVLKMYRLKIPSFKESPFLKNFAFKGSRSQLSFSVSFLVSVYRILYLFCISLFPVFRKCIPVEFLQSLLRRICLTKISLMVYQFTFLPSDRLKKGRKPYIKREYKY